MLRRGAFVFVVSVAAACHGSARTARAAEPPGTKLLIAYATLREQPRHPAVYFYEHDGRGSGKIVGKITPVDKRSDHHPTLSGNGRFCVFAAEVVAKVSTIHCWDRAENKMIELPLVNKSPQAQMAPSLSSDGRLLCFEAWNRPGNAGRWDLMLYDRRDKTFLPIENLNTSKFDERKAAFSGDGRWIAFTTNSTDGMGLTDIRLFDRRSGQSFAPPKLNTRHADTEPSLSRDGRLLTFVSDRPTGDESVDGNRNIYLYDRIEQRLLPLTGLNSPGQEQSPSLSPDGRFLTFVSERLEGTGERDILLYDRRSQKLLPTPDLNSPRDEYDPCVIIMRDSN